MAAREKTRDELDMKTLRELAALPSNKYCFDCGQRGPTYVNVTIGAFVCSACGGILRGLNPPHRVKSLTVCSFTEVEMDRIKSRGNEYCTHIWLGRYEGAPSDLSTPEKRRELMRLKYEEKTFYVDPREAIKKMKPRAPPAPTTVTQSKSQTAIVQNNKDKSLLQKSGALSQTFSAGDVLANSTSDLFNDFENDPFRDLKQKETVEASFADFSSAFGNVDSSSSSPSGQTQNSSSSNAPLLQQHVKKLAPPPPDRYAALADLDSQQHQPPVNTSTTLTNAFWSSSNVFAPSVSQNPFGSPWPQQASVSTTTQNPFSQQQSLANGSPSFWTPHWTPNGHSRKSNDAFHPSEASCNPWSLGANPFMNGSTTNGGKNPFL